MCGWIKTGKGQELLNMNKVVGGLGQMGESLAKMAPPTE
jgi:hypothetical protein